MERRFAKVSEEEIEEAFFLTIWFGKYSNNYSVKSGGYISTTIHLPFGG